jgi:hypothetical protein
MPLTVLQDVFMLTIRYAYSDMFFLCYLPIMQVPGQTVEMLLLKHARASQRSPTDSTVVFVAR